MNVSQNVVTQKIHTDMVGKIHVHLVNVDGKIAQKTVKVLSKYGLQRFADIGIDVSCFPYIVEFDNYSEYYSVSFNNGRGCDFTVNRILYDKGEKEPYGDQGVTIEEV
jgi:hypothetical protein